MTQPVVTQQVVSGDLLEASWKLYQQSFEPLRNVAVQRHVMYADEFDAVMADARVEKYLAYGEDGTLRGISTMTADLLAVPLVSPEYFAHRWPDRFRAGRIYYIGFLAVHPDWHGTGVFAEMVKRMTGEVALVDGLAIIDVCTYNKDRLHLTRAINSLAATWASHVQMATLDAQTYVGYDFARAG
jgi:GNAT superfamily N-acetyltransferase